MQGLEELHNMRAKAEDPEHELSDPSYRKLKKHLIQSVIPESPLPATRELKGGEVARVDRRALFSYGMFCILAPPSGFHGHLHSNAHIQTRIHTYMHTRTYTN